MSRLRRPARGLDWWLVLGWALLALSAASLLAVMVIAGPSPR